MTTEELLKPRRVLTNDYPFNSDGKGGVMFKIGEAMTFFKAKDRDGEYWYYHHPITHQNFQDTWFDTFPHLFKKLEWWEERKPEDMPKYIKWHQDGVTKDVYKVLAWEQMDTYPRASIGLCEVCTMCLNVEPATEQEYQKFINPPI